MKMDNKIVYSYIDEIGKRLAEPTLYGAASVMIGAGFSKNAECLGDRKQSPPDWGELAGGMFEELYPKEKNNTEKRIAECSGKNVLTLAQKYEVAFDRTELNRIIERNIADEMYGPSELHKKLMQLNWNDVFTTNYDTLLERVIKQIESKKNYRIVYSQKDLPGSVRPRLIKLHGSIGHSDNYIITEEDYRTYPDIYAPFVNTVQQSMLETRLCLLGFSGDDPNFLNWLGWLRDNLGVNCPSIYLCGIFDYLGAAERKMLENRKITIIDLGQLIPSDDENRYYNALKKFLELLERESVVKKARILKEKPFRHLMNLENCTDKIEQYASKMITLSLDVMEVMSSYICIPLNQRNEISSYFEGHLDWILDQDDFEKRIQLINNYCGILIKCNSPLFDENANKLFGICEKMQDNLEILGNIILYLLQMYRIDGNTAQYFWIRKRCEGAISKFSIYMKNELYIEFTKECLTNLDIDAAKQCIEKIEDIRNDEYALKKACLLVQMGDIEQARIIITNVLSFVAQQKYTINKMASLVGYINLIARSTWDFNRNPELFSDEDYWQNEFNCRNILTKSKDDMIGVLFESKEEQNCRKYAFNPNSYMMSYTFGRTNERKRIESAFIYLLLQDLLCIEVYDDHKNTVSMAVEIINCSSESPLWKWYKVLTMGDKKYSDNYFSRVRIFETDIKYTEKFYDQLINLVEIYLENSSKQNKLKKVGTYEIFDVISRLSIVIDTQRIIQLCVALVKYNKWEEDERQRKNTIYMVLQRIKFGFNTDILLNCMENQWDIELLKYDFLSFFTDIDLDYSKISRDKMIDIEIDILTGLKSEDEQIRNNAVIKYNIFRSIISKENIECIRAELWKKMDENGFPVNEIYLPITWLDENGYDVLEKMKVYLCNIQITRTVNGAVRFSDQNALYDLQHYFICLYRTINNISQFKLFDKEDIFKIIKYFYDYVESEKTGLNKKYDILDESEEIEKKFIEINNIVLLLCIYSRTYELLDDRFIDGVNRYINQMKEIGMYCVGVEEFISNADYKNVFEEFEDIVLSGNERLFTSAFLEIYGILQITANDETRKLVEEFLIKFIEKIPYLEVKISKRILLEFNFILQNVIIHSEKNIEIFVDTLNRCYSIYTNESKEKKKQDLDGMYNVSNLTKTLYLEMKKNSIDIGEKLLNLILELKNNRLNEVRGKWEDCLL